MAAFLRSWPFSRAISAILIISFLNLMQACYYYKAVQTNQPPESVIPALQAERNYFILHSGENVKHLYGITLDSNEIKGTIEDLSGHTYYKATNTEKQNRYRNNKNLNESEVTDEVHIYADGLYLAANSIAIPLDSIKKIEVYDPATGATIASWVFSGLGLMAGVAGIVLIILLLTKSSCPFVYSYDGQGYAFTGEIFSGATQPGFEREDFLLLPGLTDRGGIYKLKISNKVHEIQHVDLTELLIADHPRDLTVLTDKYGTIHTSGEMTSPVEALNSRGIDILSLLSSKDSLFYSGDEKTPDNKGIEEVILKFPKPASADSAKLIIKAKNDFWLEIVIAKFHALFGDGYDKFSEKQERAPGAELRQWMSDQHIPLSVYLEKNGAWEFVDYFNIAGPMAFKDDILAFGLDGVNTDTVKVKLDFGFLFWDIDYAAIDYSSNVPVNVFKCPVKSAIDENGADKLNLLTGADRNYYDQEQVGNEVTLSFDKPALTDESRTILLHTSGYYKILRDLQGKPQIKTLKTFRNPGRFPAYSMEMFVKAAAEKDIYLSGK